MLCCALSQHAQAALNAMRPGGAPRPPGAPAAAAPPAATRPQAHLGLVALQNALELGDPILQGATGRSGGRSETQGRGACCLGRSAGPPHLHIPPAILQFNGLSVVQTHRCLLLLLLLLGCCCCFAASGARRQRACAAGGRGGVPKGSGTGPALEQRPAGGGGLLALAEGLKVAISSGPRVGWLVGEERAHQARLIRAVGGCRAPPGPPAALLCSVMLCCVAATECLARRAWIRSADVAIIRNKPLINADHVQTQTVCSGQQHAAMPAPGLRQSWIRFEAQPACSAPSKPCGQNLNQGITSLPKSPTCAAASCLLAWSCRHNIQQHTWPSAPPSASPLPKGPCP